MRGYWSLLGSARFVALVLVSVLPFNGFFLYILSSPEWLGTHLQLTPTQFSVYFVISIGFVMTGAWVCGRLAGRVPKRRQVRWGFTIMAATALANVLLNGLFTAHVSWALLPVSLYAFGWSLMTPLVTVMLLDLAPQRRGLASSLQAGLGAAINGVVAGVIAPAVIRHTQLALAAAMLFGDFAEAAVVRRRPGRSLNNGEIPVSRRLWPVWASVRSRSAETTVGRALRPGRDRPY
jgi:DHA1 family bicyclomycin/chloramphenicol resistance-like MFS transporter